MDFKTLASNLGLDEEDFAELVEIFIATSYNDIGKISLGLEKNNGEAVAQAAHSIKGAAGNLGFADLSSLAKDIEMSAKQDDFNDLTGKADKINTMLKTIEGFINTD